MLICASSEVSERLALAKAYARGLDAALGPAREERGECSPGETLERSLRGLHLWGAQSGEAYSNSYLVMLYRDHCDHSFGFNIFRLSDTCRKCGGSGCSHEYHEGHPQREDSTRPVCKFAEDGAVFGDDWPVDAHRHHECTACRGSGRERIFVYNGGLIFHRSSQDWSIHT